MWLGLLDPATYHDVLQKWTVINASCCAGLIPLMQRTVLLQNLIWLKRLISLQRAGVRAKTSERSIWSCQFSIGISGSSTHKYVQFLLSICSMGINHFYDSIAATIQSIVQFCTDWWYHAKYTIYTFFLHYMKIYPWNIYQQQNVNFSYFTESLLNNHEDVLQDNRIPISFLPYMTQKSARGRVWPTQGYEYVSARAMRLYHDCWRDIMGQWKDKTQNFHLVSLGNSSRRHVC